MQNTLINAEESHLPVIHRLAHTIWPDAFKDILTQKQIAYMLEWMYSLPSLKRQMQSGHHFILIKNKDYCGYCSYEHTNMFTRLHKIYILPEMQDHGMGKSLLNEVITRARGKGQHALQLNVNRYNNAVAFYKRSGFKIVREEDNDIGNGFFMNDYVMELPL